MKSGKPHERGTSPSASAAEVTVAPDVPEQELARALRFGLRPAPTRDPSVWQFVHAAGRMVLVAPADRGGFRIDPDPRRSRLLRRLDTARRTDALPRAVGLPRRAVPPHVVDATAGLGRDALVLARLGCRVTAIERVPALAFLLATAVAAAGLGDRVAVLAAEAVAWLEGLAPDGAPDVVYLDPMFEATGSAAVQKEMQACRALAGPAGDPAALLRAARTAARERVVVKRHRAHPPLAPGVAFAVRGERVRFDVYLTPEDRAP